MCERSKEERLLGAIFGEDKYESIERLKSLQIKANDMKLDDLSDALTEAIGALECTFCEHFVGCKFECLERIEDFGYCGSCRYSKAVDYDAKVIKICTDPLSQSYFKVVTDADTCEGYEIRVGVDKH